MTEEARRARLVGADMRRMMRHHRLIGLGQHRQGDGVGGRAAEHEPHLGVRIQPLPDLIGGARGHVVAAVSTGEPLVGAHQAFDGAQRHARRIVGPEIVAHQPALPGRLRTGASMVS